MSYFRYGYDPWMIAISVLSAIPGIVGLAIGGDTKNAGPDLPFWLLTVYIVLLIAMYLTSCFILNEAKKDENPARSPLTIASISLMVVYLVVALSVSGLDAPMLSFGLGMAATISLSLMAVERTNWISLGFSTAFLATQIAAICIG